MSTISAGTTVGTALVNSGDTTGNLVIKTGSNATTALTISGTDQSITVAGGLNLGAPVAVASGGTGSNTASGARTNLSAAQSGANSDITSLSGLTTALSIAQGGTGANTATAAFNALNPMTTTGDIIYEASSTVAARLGIGSTGQVLTVAGGLPSWASLPAGGVTSLNGQTGAITNTDLYAIGSYVCGRPPNGTNYNANSTIAGSSLRTFPTGVVMDNNTDNAYLAYFNDGLGNIGVTIGSGTWRCTSRAFGDGSRSTSGIWVRIS